MTTNPHTKHPTAAAMSAACLLAAVLGGCASGTDSLNSGLAASTAGSRMGLPIPACEACASADRTSPAEPCAENCLGLCCRY